MQAKKKQIAVVHDVQDYNEQVISTTCGRWLNTENYEIVSGEDNNHLIGGR